MVAPDFSFVLRNSGFRTLWLNQALMQLSINAINFSLIIWVYQLTNSNFAVSTLILSIYLPSFIFGILAGVLVDIVDKKKVIVLVDILLALLIFVFTFTKDYYPLILINMFLINCATQFFIPAESSSIPYLVGRKFLFLANALFSLTLYSSFMIGYTLAGPVFDNFGINVIFYLGSGALFFAFLIAQRLPSIGNSGSMKKLKIGIYKLVLNEARITFSFIKGKLNVAVAMGLLVCIQMGIGILAVMVSGYMEKVLKIQASDASLVLMMPLGLGMISGALLVGRLFDRTPRRFVVRPAILAVGILLFIVGLAPNLPYISSFFTLVAFILGVCVVSIIIPSQTILQENTPGIMRGKIFSFLSVSMNVFAMIPILLAGWLADIFGEANIFIGIGVIVFFIGLITLKPAVFFAEHTLPYKWREFLGLGHWQNYKV